MTKKSVLCFVAVVLLTTGALQMEHICHIGQELGTSLQGAGTEREYEGFLTIQRFAIIGTGLSTVMATFWLLSLAFQTPKSLKAKAKRLEDKKRVTQNSQDWDKRHAPRWPELPRKL